MDNFDDVANELKERLNKNPYFLTLKDRNELIKGKKAFLFNRAEIVKRAGDNVSFYKGMYNFLSNQVHSLPMSFYKMQEKGRGTGLENNVDKGYMAFTIEYISQHLLSASIKYLELYPSVKEKLTKMTIEIIEREFMLFENIKKN